MAYLGLGIQDGLLHGLGPLSPRPRWGWYCREDAQGKTQGKSYTLCLKKVHLFMFVITRSNVDGF